MKKTTKKILSVLFPAAFVLTVTSAIYCIAQTPSYTNLSTDYVYQKSEKRYHNLTNPPASKTVGAYAGAPQYYVIPSGEAIGIRVHSDGVLVVGMGEVRSSDGKLFSPAKKAGICEGDRITAVNGERIINSSGFSKKINECDGVAVLTIIRENEIIECRVRPAYSQDGNCLRVGLWVKDSTAGIGTMTFYNPQNSTFAALGHAICESDTKEIFSLSRGSVSLCSINGVNKGIRGVPGELLGSFSDEEIATVTTNCDMGIYGTTKKASGGEKVAVASAFEIKEGPAKILCDVDGNGVQSYDIEITKINISPEYSSKCFNIKVTDNALIEKTGGIVRGMSGSPILQNNMLVGAVTHVFVNDPTRGYGIFAEYMLAKTEKTE